MTTIRFAVLPIIAVVALFLFVACGGHTPAGASPPDTHGIVVVDVPMPSGGKVRCAIATGGWGGDTPALSCDWSVPR